MVIKNDKRQVYDTIATQFQLETEASNPETEHSHPKPNATPSQHAGII